MARKSTIKLLLINESDNESERLISLFRNAGRVARPFRPMSADELHSMLEQDNWDLLIANDRHPEISVIQCLEWLQKMQLELPSLVIRDSDTEAALNAGANDVIGSNEDHRLIHAAFRELRHLEQSRKLATTLEKLRDAEARSKLLMAESQDAIAYLADGMLIHCNDLFSGCFGYSDPEELDCAPMIDLIDPADHSKFKTLLKKQTTESHSIDFNFTALKHNHDNFAATMQLSNAVYDDEPCIQLTIKEKSTGAASNTATAGPDRDAATGLYSHDYFIDQLQAAVALIEANSSPATLLYMSIDNYTSFRSRYGITHAYNILLDIARIIQDESAEDNCLAHFCDDGFTMLLQATDETTARQYAEKLCNTLEKHILEIDGQSLQCTASIGLVPINSELQQREPNALIDMAFNTCEQVRVDADNDGIGNGVAVYVPVREKKSLGNAAGDEELDSFLEEALEEQRFSLNFQPVVSLRGSSGDHYEVRTTMKNEEGENLAAEEFLNNIQFSGINTRLDRWVLLEATKKLAAEIESGNNTLLLINLTANALQDESLISWLGVALKAGGIPPEALIFQFSESDITNFLKPAKAFAEAIKALGCKLCISQFGQSNNPFKALKQVQADFAKISGEFTQDLQSGGDTQVLKALVNSINEHQAQAIISGVENAASLAQLWQIGVDYIQGGYLAGPTTSMDYEFTDIA